MDQKWYRKRGGCIPIRINPETNTLEVCIIQSSNRKHWVLPCKLNRTYIKWKY